MIESHLDPFGCVTSFLDAAFRNVFNNGIVVATCTDVAALYGTCPALALRNYGARVARTDFVKEMAARVVVSAFARCVFASISCLNTCNNTLVLITPTYTGLFCGCFP